jgi:voltage-gated potassium channel Kch
VTLVGLITISASTYMILYSHQLYAHLAPYLGWFERKVAHREIDSLSDSDERVDVLLFGLGRFGSTIATMLRDRGCRIQAIDFDPTVVKQHEQEGYQTRYGDVEDPEFIATLPLQHATLVVSTLRNRVLNRSLLQGLTQQGYQGKVAVSTATLREAEEFQLEGVDLVLVPYADAAKEAADRLVRECRECPVAHDSGVHP